MRSERVVVAERRRWIVDLFSRSGMNLIGALLLLTIVSTIIGLWDVAIRRWFG